MRRSDVVCGLASYENGTNPSSLEPWCSNHFSAGLTKSLHTEDPRETDLTYQALLVTRTSSLVVMFILKEHLHRGSSQLFVSTLSVQSNYCCSWGSYRIALPDIVSGIHGVYSFSTYLSFPELYIQNCLPAKFSLSCELPSSETDSSGTRWP